MDQASYKLHIDHIHTHGECEVKELTWLNGRETKTNLITVNGLEPLCLSQLINDNARVLSSYGQNLELRIYTLFLWLWRTYYNLQGPGETYHIGRTTELFGQPDSKTNNIHPVYIDRWEVLGRTVRALYIWNMLIVHGVCCFLFPSWMWTFPLVNCPYEP